MSETITNKNFSEAFEKAKKEWLSNDEQKTLKTLFDKLPKTEKRIVINKYANLKNQPEKSFFEWLKNQLQGLREDIEKPMLKWGFEEIKESFKNSEISKEFFELIESYIDLKLDKSFKKEQKDKIKLALLWEIESWFNLSTITEWFLNKVLKPLKAQIDKLKSGDFDDATNTKDIPWMDKITDDMTEMFEDFWLDLKVKELNEKIEKINDEKDSWEITDLKSVLNIINPDNAQSINFDTIKTKTEKIVWVLDSWRKVTDNIQSGLKKLPFWLWDMITKWIRNTIKEGEILWMILWFFFWKEFMDESWEKQTESIKNLQKYSKDKDFVLKENIKSDDLKDLKPEKLKDFYEYLDNKKIDYSKETFWQDLLTWKAENKKIYELLKNKDWKVLEEKEKLEDLVDKLNW